MKLQFAFPNPMGKRRGKKSVAKHRKKRKTGSVKSKLKKAVHVMAKKRKSSKRVLSKMRRARDKAARVMKLKKVSPKRRKAARKTHSKLYARIKKRTGRNPIVAYATKGGRRIGQTSTRTRPEMKAALKRDKTLARFKRQMDSLRKQKRYDEVKALGVRVARLMKLKAEKMQGDRAAFAKDVKTYKADGAEITFAKTKEKGGAVAKKRRKKTKKHVAKKHAKKKHAKKKHTKRKHTKKRVKARKGYKRASKRRGRRRKMLTHTHAKSTRHIRRGSKAKFSARKRKGSYKVSTHFGKGKRRVRMSGRARVSKGVLHGIFKINPFRSNPVNFKSRSGAEKFLGHDPVELGTMAAAAFGAPYVTKMILPYIAQYVPAALAPYISGLIPVGVGAALNFANDAKMKNGHVQSFADALIAVGVISAVYSTGAKSAGLSGINYTPHMGIMPQLSGINYTPNMGIMPQLNGITNRGDFGAPGDYGGNAGYRQSRADFGSDWSSDSESDMYSDEGDLHSSSMN